MTAGRRATGVWGEDQVARWYVERGYEVLARNWRVRDGELDLVVALGDLVAFCEVKSRSSAVFGEPFEAVTAAKQQRLRRLAAQWLRADGRSWATVRFDVASVLRGRVVGVIEAAF